MEGMVQEAPPLLFATFAHMDILGLGGCPWAYLTALSDVMLVVGHNNLLNHNNQLKRGKLLCRSSKENNTTKIFSVI